MTSVAGTRKNFGLNFSYCKHNIWQSAKFRKRERHVILCVFICCALHYMRDVMPHFNCQKKSFVGWLGKPVMLYYQPWKKQEKVGPVRELFFWWVLQLCTIFFLPLQKNSLSLLSWLTKQKPLATGRGIVVVAFFCVFQAKESFSPSSLMNLHVVSLSPSLWKERTW